MPGFRQKKQELRALLLQKDWLSVSRQLAALPPVETVSPLLSFLPHGGLLKWRAVLALGVVVNRLAGESMEGARIVMRRLLWHLNEDSGNIGWGIAESMGQILAHSPDLANEYGRILLSYARRTGKADNYIEHGPLRRGVYWGIGRFASAHALFRPLAVSLLAEGLRDEDMAAAGVAAWALGQLAALGPCCGREWEKIVASLRALRTAAVLCEALQGEEFRQEAACVFAREALAVVLACRRAHLAGTRLFQA